MASRRTENNYKREKVWNFLMDVKTSVNMGAHCDETFSQICKRYRFGQISLPALRACGFIETKGRGFQNWDWIKIAPISSADVDHFIAEIDRQKTLIHKKQPKQNIQVQQPSNLLNFKKAETKKAVQTELPIHPVRLKVLNEIRTQLNEIRLQMEKIEDRIDQECTKKAVN
jgi:hypothetical protein